jgi:FtsP/CotA-like multicopper oxidase with cupredoxin domain
LSTLSARPEDSPVITRRSTRHLSALAAASLLLLAGCGGGDDKADDAVVPPVQPAVTAAATPSETPSVTATPSDSASASPSASASADQGTVIEINLVGGKPDPVLEPTQRFAKGDTITIRVTTDKAYEVHIHGYDYSLDAKPGETVEKTFTLDKQGSFEVEVEELSKLLFNLQVR